MGVKVVLLDSFGKLSPFQLLQFNPYGSDQKFYGTFFVLNFKSKNFQKILRMINSCEDTR